jgi:glycerol dehydrogenase
MIDYKAPRYYANERGALMRAGAFIGPVTRKLFVVAGATAFSVVRDRLCGSLNGAGIAFDVYEYRGYPEDEEARRIAERARSFGAGAVAGVGGGRIMDIAKAAGDYAGLPVVTIPTIAATCACWAAVSVMYSPDGVMRGPLYCKNAPYMVIADIDVLAKAPPRYICAGIADTLAKWYEAYPNLKTSNDFYLRLVVKYGEFAREILETLGLKVVSDLFAGIYNTDEVMEVVDGIFAIAGLCGAVRGLASIQGVAHPFYNACSALPELRGKLHGEKVAFGLVMQAALEQREPAEIEHRIAVFKKLHLPLSLRELGLSPGFDEKFAVIASFMGENPVYPGLEKPWTRDELRRAIITADRMVEQYGKREREAQDAGSI